MKFAKHIAAATLGTVVMHSNAAASEPSTAGHVRFDWHLPYNQGRPLDARQAHLRKLEEYSRLPIGWSGYADSAPPSVSAIEDMQSMIFELPFHALGAARLALAPDGEISLIWEKNNRSSYLELGVLGDGYVSIYAEDDGVTLPISQDILLDAMPPSVSTFISEAF
jgi:hypothetical protein